MILYHYDISPFSEKIRLLLAHTNTQWQSHTVPPMPPRDTLDIFIGGYRKIPVAQLGADFFCDTRLIADEIAASSGYSHLAYTTSSAAVKSFIDRTNGSVFMAIVQGAKPRTVLAMLVRRYWPWQILALMKDRAAMGKASNMPKVNRQARAELIQNWLNELEERLSQHDFLYGDKASLADFAAYHVAWFADLTRPTKLLNRNSAAGKWQARMQSIGTGNFSPISHVDCLRQASANPRTIVAALKQHEWIGQTVSIGPTDYGLERVEGELVGVDDSRWIIAREIDKAGIVHIHFPTIGFDASLS